MGTAPDPEAIVESSVVRRRPDVATVAVGADAVLVDEPDGRAHAVNATGALIWECLDGLGDLAGLVDDVAAEFGADRQTVADDVVGLARDLARLGLLEGFHAAADAWPEEPAPDDDGCPPEADAPDPTFDDRYLAAPPNG